MLYVVIYYLHDLHVMVRHDGWKSYDCHLIDLRVKLHVKHLFYLLIEIAIVIFVLDMKVMIMHRWTSIVWRARRRCSPPMKKGLYHIT